MQYAWNWLFIMIVTIYPVSSYAGLLPDGEFEMDAERWENRERISAGKQIGQYQGKLSGVRLVQPAFSFNSSSVRQASQITVTAEIRKVLDKRFFETIHVGSDWIDASNDLAGVDTGQSKSLYAGPSVRLSERQRLRLSVGYEHMKYGDESFGGVRTSFQYQFSFAGGFLEASGQYSKDLHAYGIGFSRPLSECNRVGARLSRVNGRRGLRNDTFLMVTFSHSFGVAGKCKRGSRSSPLSLERYTKESDTGKIIRFKKGNIK